MKFQRRILFVGDEAIGKTCFCYAVQDKPIPTTYLPTIEDVYEVPYGNQTISMVDTAGSSAFDRLRPFSYEGCTQVVYCFSLADYDSLLSLEDKWKPEIQYYTQINSFILLGFYSDQKSVNLDVSKIESVQKALECSKYLEATALDSETCQEAFRQILEIKDGIVNKRLPQILEEAGRISLDSIELPPHSRMLSNVPTQLVAMSSQETLGARDSTCEERSTLILEQPIDMDYEEKYPTGRRHTLQANTLLPHSQSPLPMTRENTIVQQTSESTLNTISSQKQPSTPNTISSQKQASNTQTKEQKAPQIPPMPLPKKDYHVEPSPKSAIPLPKKDYSDKQNDNLRKFTSELNLRNPQQVAETRKKKGWSLFRKKEKPVGFMNGSGYHRPTVQSDSPFMNYSSLPKAQTSSLPKSPPKKKGFLSRIFK